jgi:phosphatidylinositol alpha-1,6-mannosyltransferase
VTVITGSGPEAGSQERRGHIRHIRLPMSADDWGLTSRQSVWRYVRLAARLRLECRQNAIVHCGRALPEGFAALLAKRLCGGSSYLCWTHGEELAYARSSRELRFLLARVHNSAAAVIANSHNTARQLEAMGVSRAKLHVVYPGVDAARFQGRVRGDAIRRRFVQEGELLLLTVARLQRRKGHDLSIRALALLRDEPPGLRYLIVGDGEERGHLERLVDELALRDRVSFLGAVPDDVLPDYYAAADIFVHPNRPESREEEGFGMVFLEAAAAGLPVIGGANGGVPEAVEQSVTGLLVGGDDAGELATAIRALSGSKALRCRMGEAGRTRVLSHFTWERAAADVAAIHRQLAKDT